MARVPSDETSARMRTQVIDQRASRRLEELTSTNARPRRSEHLTDTDPADSVQRWTRHGPDAQVETPAGDPSSPARKPPVRWTGGVMASGRKRSLRDHDVRGRSAAVGSGPIATRYQTASPSTSTTSIPTARRLRRRPSRSLATSTTPMWRQAVTTSPQRHRVRGTRHLSPAPLAPCGSSSASSEVSSTSTGAPMARRLRLAGMSTKKVLRRSTPALP